IRDLIVTGVQTCALPIYPGHLIVGNDGGGAVSTDTSRSWTDEDYPTEQFYHAITTAHVPYHVCGSQQDNSTLCTPFNWNAAASRSEERRVGKECRSWWWA